MTSTPEGSEAAYLWTRARLLAAEVAVSRPAAALLLPEALRLAEPPTATLFVADYPETRFGSVYREAAVLLHVSDDRGPALHCPWMVVDEDTALILGREVLGFPKKLAEIALEERGAHVVGTVRRRGTEVMRLEAELGAPEADPAPLFAQRMINVIGTLVGGLQLVELPPTQESIRASRSAEVKVTLASSDRDPLAELSAAPSGRARYLELDFGAEGGPQPALLGAVDAAWTERRFFARAL